MCSLINLMCFLKAGGLFLFFLCVGRFTCFLKKQTWFVCTSDFFVCVRVGVVFLLCVCVCSLLCLCVSCCVSVLCYACCCYVFLFVVV